MCGSWRIQDEGKRGREVDFLLRQGMKIEGAVQVCADPEDEKTNKREINSLMAAMEEFELKEGIIVTMDLAKQLTMEGRTITYVPLFEWLLS
ncbi:MAG: ATP-binding protein [Proteobacteria bacterium]|nr:ATP-binding protein [Pseudomonadota bacterium]